MSRLMDYLQLAAFALVALRFDRKVTNELELWGFKVVEKSTPEQSTPLDQPPAPAA